MVSRRYLVVGLGAVLVAGGAVLALRREDVGTATYFAKDGIALRGADPVAYFTQQTAVIGSADFSQQWRGVTWHFANADHRDLFKKDPEKYAPQYGGYCAWAVAAKQELYSIQPENWAVRDGKLYLNFSDSVQETWDTDQEGFIKKADEVWPTVRSALG